MTDATTTTDMIKTTTVTFTSTIMLSFHLTSRVQNNLPASLLLADNHECFKQNICLVEAAVSYCWQTSFIIRSHLSPTGEQLLRRHCNCQQKPTLTLPPLLTGSVCQVVRRTWLQQMEEDIGLSVGAAQIASQDRSMWSTLQPSAVTEWVSEWVSEAAVHDDFLFVGLYINSVISYLLINKRDLHNVHGCIVAALVGPDCVQQADDTLRQHHCHHSRPVGERPTRGSLATVETPCSTPSLRNAVCRPLSVVSSRRRLRASYVPVSHLLLQRGTGRYSVHHWH